ncbi:Arf GTPase activating protein, partial [Gonapodya prolifera JEL478]
PRWASVNIGCFLCIRCGGLHRKMGTHISKVKSLTLDSWPPEAIAFMKEMGNAKVNAIYIPQPSKSPAPPTQSDSEMEHYIRQKYEQRRF